MAWAVGDLAVCVDAGRLGKHGPAVSLRVGAHYRVAGIQSVAGFTDRFFSLAGVKIVEPNTGIFNERRFRKIVHDEQTACEPEFITLVKRGKQGVSASSKAVEL
jgi:hypothetical protein